MEGGSHAQRRQPLPELIQDAGSNAEALTLPVTRALPVGAHVSIPIRLADGRVCGTLCCFDTAPDPSLNPRDLNVMKAFGAIAADLISMSVGKSAAQGEIRDRVAEVIAAGSFQSVYQPIYRVADNHLMGYEALTRFPAERSRRACAGPARWRRAWRDGGALSAGARGETRTAAGGGCREVSAIT